MYVSNNVSNHRVHEVSRNAYHNVPQSVTLCITSEIASRYASRHAYHTMHRTNVILIWTWIFNLSASPNRPFRESFLEEKNLIFDELDKEEKKLLSSSGLNVSLLLHW